MSEQAYLIQNLKNMVDYIQQDTKNTIDQIKKDDTTVFFS